MKPQSKAKPLDEVDVAPHPSGMDGKDRDEKPAPDPREAKLAAALRANLRRRKAGARPGRTEAPKNGASD